MKNITISKIALVVVALLLLLSIGLNVKQFLTAEAKSERIGDLIQTQVQVPIRTYVKDSITHTVYSEKLIHDNESEKNLAIGKTYADSLESALKMSINKIDQVTKYAANLQAQLQLKESSSESGKRVLSHKDKTIALDYYPDTDSVDLAVNIELNDVRYGKKKWLFGSKENFIDLFATDSRITISGLKNYTIKEKPQKKLGVGISAGYGITAQDNTLKTTPYFGIGINYNLIEF